MSYPTLQNELDRLFSRLPVALYRTSLEGRVLAANDAAAQLLGYASVEDLTAVGNIAEECYVDPNRRLDWQQAVEAEGVVHNFQAQMRKHDGQIIWVRDTARTIFDESGHARFYEGVLTDITSEVEARTSSAVLAGVLNATSDLIVIFDDSGSLRYANEASRRFLGIDAPADDKRPHFNEMFPDIEWDTVVGTIDTRGWSGELSLDDAEGRTCPLWVVVTVHHDRSGRRYVSGTARELTMMKRTQQRLEELVIAKDDFVATVSHELRHPLTGVMGLAEELRDRFDEFGAQERRDLISLIAHEAAEMMSLVDDLLVASRADGGDFAVVLETMDIVTLLARIASSLEAEIAWHLPETELPVRVDPHRFRQIIRNLVSNAQRHGGGDIRVGVALHDTMVVVSVSDSGGGVDPAEIESIFEPFQRAEGAPLKSGSLGLGLNVARRLARYMGGDLQYERNEGRTSFQLSVPAADSLAPRQT